MSLASTRGALGLFAAAVIAVAPGWSQTLQQAPRNAIFVAKGVSAGRQQAVTSIGVATVLFHYFNLTAACRPTSVVVKVVTPPAHGTIDVKDGEERPYTAGKPIFPATDPRHVCSARLTADKDAVYTPVGDFAGDDSAVIEVDEGGAKFIDTVAVSVLSTPFHTSVAAVDCLWEAAPAPFKQWVIEAPSIASLVQQAESYWNPTDRALMEMAEKCGVADTPLAFAGETAAVVILIRTIEAFTERRLATVDQLGVEDLERAWGQVTPQDRAGMARQLEDSLTKNEPMHDLRAVTAFAAGLHPTDESEVRNLLFYAYARATMEAIVSSR